MIGYIWLLMIYIVFGVVSMYTINYFILKNKIRAIKHIYDKAKVPNDLKMQLLHARLLIALDEEFTCMTSDQSVLIKQFCNGDIDYDELKDNFYKKKD